MFEIDFTFNEPFELASGEVLDEVRLRCTIYGRLNADKSNAVLVFHALTGSSRIGDWWNWSMLLRQPWHATRRRPANAWR